MADSKGSRVVVVTGASSGLGRAAALAFARRGDRLVLTARNSVGLGAAALACRELGADAVTIVADVCIEAEVRAVAERALQHFGGIDVWVNNAGTTLFAPLEQGDVELHRKVIETNLFGSIHGARAVVPIFRRQRHGVLINVGSVLSSVGQAFVPAYVISKYGVHGLSEALRVELADEPDIHVCTLLPYAIDTPHFENAANLVGKAAHPMPPTQKPEEVAKALVSLADRPRRVLHVPRSASLGLFLHALLPRTTERTLLDALRKWHVAGSTPVGEGNLHHPIEGSGKIHGSRPPLVGTLRLGAWAAARMAKLLLTGNRTRA